MKGRPKERLPRFFATTLRGLEEIVLRQARRVAGAVRRERHTGWVQFDVPTNLDRIRRLRSANCVYVHVREIQGDYSRPRQLSELARRLNRTDLRESVEVWQRTTGNPPPQSFRVTCEARAGKGIQFFELHELVKKALTGKGIGLPGDREADLTVYLQAGGQGAILGLELWRTEPLASTAHVKAAVPVGLWGAAAFLLEGGEARAIGVAGADAALVAELAAQAPETRLVAWAPHTRDAAGVRDWGRGRARLAALRATLHEWPIRGETLDRAVLVLGSAPHEAALPELARALAPQGRAVVVLGEVHALEQGLRRANLTLREHHGVTIGARRVHLAVLQRTRPRQ